MDSVIKKNTIPLVRKSISRREFLGIAGKAALGLFGIGIGFSSVGYAEYGNPFRTRVPDIEFADLPLRAETDSVVIHHIGSNDADAPSEQINQWHLANGWQGIGYHYVIRKDGLIEYGRPLDCEGAHTYHENGHTVGILVDG